MGGVGGKIRFEMENVLFDVFVVFANENCIIVKESLDFVGAFQFCGQLSVFVQKVMYSRKHLLVE